MTTFATILCIVAPATCVTDEPETRPENAARNRNNPPAQRLQDWRETMPDWLLPQVYLQRVNGRYRGTTDGILQWGAAKWGFDPDFVRAQAWVESTHSMDTVGDDGHSFGLLQVKDYGRPMTERSTAFGVDLGLAILRTYYDGLMSWMTDKNPAYQAGDIWGSLGAYYSGGWYTDDSLWYQAKVKGALRDRAWEQDK